MATFSWAICSMGFCCIVCAFFLFTEKRYKWQLWFFQALGFNPIVVYVTDKLLDLGIGILDKYTKFDDLRNDTWWFPLIIGPIALFIVFFVPCVCFYKKKRIDFIKFLVLASIPYIIVIILRATLKVQF